MVEMNMEISGQDYPLYHGGEEQGEEDGMGPVSYPQRPGEVECQYYMKTGTCKYATKCKFHHPPDVTPSWGTVAPATDVTIGLNKESYPRRPGETQCTFFLKTGTCKYKMSCKFDHPPEAIQQTLQLQSTPYPLRPGELQCAYYLKTGKCKFGATCRFDHPPMAPEQAAALAAAAGQYAAAAAAAAAGGVVGNGVGVGGSGHVPPPGGVGGAGGHAAHVRGGPMGYYAPHEGGAGGGMMGMVAMPGGQHMVGMAGFAPPPPSSHSSQLPQRPGEKECTFFLRTGRCQYGLRCKFHHPIEKVPGGMQMRGAGVGGGNGGIGGAGGGGDGQLPSRPGQEACSFYLRTGKCSYGSACRFDHPRVGGGLSRETSVGEGGRDGGRGEGGQAENGGRGAGREGGREGGAGAGNGGGDGGQGGYSYQQEGVHMYGGSQQGGYGGGGPGGYMGEGGVGGGGGGGNGHYPGAEAYQQAAFMGYPPVHHHQYVAQTQQAVYSNYRQAS
ncbi:zinc finger ccch type domain containing protein expressed [Nannochloropsis oceanica]